MTSVDKIRKTDKLKGVMYAVMLGDAGGVMHEFKNQTKQPFQPLLENYKESTVTFKFTQKKLFPGQASDDTEMTVALFRALKDNDWKYDKEKVLRNYLDWANKSSYLGKNTRALMKGVKTIRGYTNRFNKLSEEEKVDMQSNGSLMRASPLAFLANYESVAEDCSLTNPNKVNITCGMLYITILKTCIVGCEKKIIRGLLEGELDNLYSDDLDDDDTHTYEGVRSMLRAILNEDESNEDEKKFSAYTVSKKGWVCTSFYVAVKAFLKFNKFEDAIKWIVDGHPGSDTDTNAAICGGLFGAHLGYKKLMESEVNKRNVEFILSKYPTQYVNENLF
jgi:ADP-ribosyl-[dinitrogen reductase] hydrolase